MIVDIFNEVLTKIKTDISTATVLSEYPETTPTFPCIVIQELSNTTDTTTVDTGGEQYNHISFEINIFDNGDTKRTVCRNLRNSIDAIMSEYYGMNRTDGGSVPNYMDSSIYRYNLKYDFKIDNNKKIYRR